MDGARVQHKKHITRDHEKLGCQLNDFVHGTTRHAATDATCPIRQSCGAAYLIAVAQSFMRLEGRPSRYRISLDSKSLSVLEEHGDVAKVLGCSMSEALGKDAWQSKLDSRANVDERVVQPLEQLGKHVFGDRSAVTTVLVENSLPTLGFDIPPE